MRPTAVVVGVGPLAGLGAGLCRQFAAKGHHVLAAGRSLEKITAVAEAIRASGGSATAVPTDATREDDVVALMERAFAEGDGTGPADLIVYNVGDNRRIALLDTTADEFEGFWRAGCFGGFLVGREAARRMAPRGRGTILFTGASGSLRGMAGFAHSAAAKSGLRMVAQAMARGFGPLGIHVAHVILDGAIAGDRVRTRFPDFVEERGEDGLLEIAAIADAYWMLYSQHPSAWTHELDLRPYKEKF